MKNIAIIPARSGSKGLKDKNIKELSGRPLLYYTIEAALKSNKFDKVMVSTDSLLYAEIAKKYGAEVPFLRSRNTSDDSASSWSVVEEVVSKYEAQGENFDSFCLLQPTSPLRTAEDIVTAYDLYENKATLAVVSVCEAEHSPLWCGHLPEDLELSGFVRDEGNKRRQDIEKFYRINGAIYIVNIEQFKKSQFLYQKGSFAYIMPQSRSVDIDTEMDFKLAEIIMKEKEDNPEN